MYASTITSAFFDTSVFTRDLLILTVTHAFGHTATIFVIHAKFSANQLFATATWVRFVIIGALFDALVTFL